MWNWRGILCCVLLTFAIERPAPAQPALDLRQYLDLSAAQVELLAQVNRFYSQVVMERDREMAALKPDTIALRCAALRNFALEIRKRNLSNLSDSQQAILTSIPAGKSALASEAQAANLLSVPAVPGAAHNIQASCVPTWTAR